jgi:DNA helicase-2/ATP-dependent DNA helicase PcrA
MHGSENFCRPSRFIDEMPAEFLEEIRPRTSSRQPWVPARPSSAPGVVDQDWPFKLGQVVMHAKFGEGTVVSFEGSGEHTRVQVNFLDAGAKWLVLAYAKLQPRHQ